MQLVIAICLPKLRNLRMQIRDEFGSSRLEASADDEIVELNIPTGVPLVYELDAHLTPITHYYLGDPNDIRRAEQAVIAQGHGALCPCVA